MDEIKKIPIPTPGEKELQKYLNTWESLENYVAQEKALNNLFFKVYPNNTNIHEVLIKVSTLNDFYSTNIFSPYIIAKHIITLNIDKKLKEGDISLVEDIANVSMSKDKKIYFYSFATKYCSHHQPSRYPIYDSFVDEVLWHYKKENNYSTFKRKDLKNYNIFNKTLKDFKDFYNLNNYSLKEIDKYLWQFGKDYFNKNIKCPVCSSSKREKIIYGMPTEESLKQDQTTPLHQVNFNQDSKHPIYHCQNCGYKW
ncbi:MAG: hypothetical protein OWP43_11435 [Sphaerochaetaceae bacterium]|nr:hypothetical protein [Sphaerochaetaceae bacterium]